jgi:predicted lipase
MFKFNLPKELLAEHPAKNRDESKLMVVDRATGKITHKKFKDIINYFDDGDVMILNDTTVFNYKFSNDEKAFVHHGWAIGTCYLAPYVAQKINEYYKKGVKEYIIVGHSQGAALSFLMRSYLQYLPDSILPKDIKYKVYCSAAPKPGNLFYSYDFDFITRDGWAYRIVNTNDWVPQTPFSVQTISDLHPTNPLAKRKQLMKRRLKKCIKMV